MGKIKDSFVTVGKYFIGAGYTDSFATSVENGWIANNLRDLQKEYKNLVFTCMNIRADEASTYEPLLYRTNPRVKESDPLEDHPFLQLLDNPAPRMSKKQLFEATSLDTDNYGLAYWYVPLTASGKPAEPGADGWGIQLVDPWRVQKKYDEATGQLLGYEVLRHDGTYAYLDVNELWEFRAPRGKGIIEANFLYIDTENETSTFQNAFMHNSATPSGVATVKGSITKDAFDKLKKSWRAQQQGARNAGKTLFIRNGDFTFEKTGLSIAELDMGTLKNTSKDEVRTAFRVPKPKLGDVDGAGLGRGNVETVDYMFAKDVIDNIQLRWDDTLQWYIRECYREDLFVDHVSMVPANQEFLLQQDKELVDTVISRNEIRKRRGLPEKEHGDELYVPSNVTALNEVFNHKEPTQAAVTVRTISTKHTPKAIEAPVEKKSSENVFFDRWDRIENRIDNTYLRTISSLLNKQEKQVISIIQQRYKMISKALDEDIETQIDSDLEAWLAALFAILIPGVEDAGNIALLYVGSPDGSFVLQQSVRDALYDHTERLIEQFGRETALDIKREVTIALENRESIEQLTARIEKVYTDSKGYRAARIAQTEAHRAINLAIKEGYLQGGVTKIVWKTDDKPCEFCAVMDGTVVDIRQAFLDLGDVVTGASGKTYNIDYLPVEAADLHPNCRCKLVPFTERTSSYKTLIKIVDDEENQRLQKALEESQLFNRQLLDTFGVEDE